MADTQKPLKLEVLPVGNGDWTWRLVAANGRTIEPGVGRRSRIVETAERIANSPIQVVVREG